MCIFAGSVHDVSSTAIFARGIGNTRQVLVYSMALTASTDVAMVLPLPVPSGSAEEAVRFIDLSVYPKFFGDLDRAFPGKKDISPRGGVRLSLGMQPQLVVHEVGSFEGSFAIRGSYPNVDVVV